MRTIGPIGSYRAMSAEPPLTPPDRDEDDRPVAAVLDSFRDGSDVALPTVGGITSANTLLRHLSPDEADDLASAIAAAMQGHAIVASRALQQVAEAVALRYAEEHGAEFADVENSRAREDAAADAWLARAECER